MMAPEELASLRSVVPELLLSGGCLAALGFQAAQGRWPRALLATSLGTLVSAAAALVLVPPVGSVFGGLWQADGVRAAFGAVALAGLGLGLLQLHHSREVAAQRRGELHALLLAMGVGLLAMASASELLTIYLGVELVSLCSYAATGLKSGDARSSEAALKYAVYGGAASALMLFGISLLYGLTGELQLSSVGSALLAGGAGTRGAAIALSLLLGGVAFKVAAAPFHMWVPDAYEGAPTPVAAVFSVAPKLAGFALALRLGLVLVPPSGPLLTGWLLALGLVSALSMTLGNLAALVQPSAKRLLAYSSVAHAGTLALGLCAHSEQGSRALWIYAALYGASSFGAFGVLQAVSRAGSEQVGAFRGLGTRAPALAALFAVFLVGLTGLPPLSGFTGKFLLLQALVQRGDARSLTLAAVAVLNTALSFAVYARLLHAMYFQPAGALHRPSVRRAEWATLSALGAVTVLFGLWWTPLFTWSGSLGS